MTATIGYHTGTVIMWLMTEWYLWAPRGDLLMMSVLINKIKLPYNK
jgi:hypothetical protein